MKTTILRTDIWKDDELYKLHLDSKLLYLFILSHPERGNFHLFQWNKRVATMYTGMNDSQLEVALGELVDAGFVDVYNGYIAILKEHFSVTKNRFSDNLEAEMLAELPKEVFSYFIDKQPIPHQEKKAKKPKEDKVSDVEKLIAEQPEAIQQALRDFLKDRKDRKKSATFNAVKLWVLKLNKMYPNDFVRQTESIEQSIERGWSGLFEVQDTKKAGGGKFM